MLEIPAARARRKRHIFANGEELHRTDDRTQHHGPEREQQPANGGPPVESDERSVWQFEFGECDKVTGDDCFVARLFVRSIGDLDGILDRIADKAETSTAIIKAQPIRRRPPPLVAPSSSSS